MIRKLRESDGSTLGFALMGRVDAASNEKWNALLAASIELHDVVRVLLDLREYGKVRSNSIEDFGWLGFHGKAIGKLAFVGDQTLRTWYVNLQQPITCNEERWFEAIEANDAWLWLRTG